MHHRGSGRAVAPVNTSTAHADTLQLTSKGEGVCEGLCEIDRGREM